MASLEVQQPASQQYLQLPFRQVVRQIERKIFRPVSRGKHLLRTQPTGIFYFYNVRHAEPVVVRRIHEYERRYAEIHQVRLVYPGKRLGYHRFYAEVFRAQCGVLARRTLPVILARNDNPAVSLLRPAYESGVNF